MHTGRDSDPLTFSIRREELFVTTAPGDGSARSPAPPSASVTTIDARIDALPRVGIGRAGAVCLFMCYFFANYDITVFSITIPSVARDFGASGASLGWPVTMNLIGFSAGAYAFGYIADRRGRRVGLFWTILVLGLGGLLGAFSWDMASFTFFRFVTGCGMGAVLALGSTYIGEMAPPAQRGRYLAKIYTAGAVFISGIGFVSLSILESLPSEGWRVLIGFGGLVLLALPMLNDRMLHESPRWLSEKGHQARAESLVARMERRAGVTPAVPGDPSNGRTIPSDGQAAAQKEPLPARSLFQPPYLTRIAIILGFWFIYYIGSYSYLSYTPLIFSGLGASESTALFITVASRVVNIIVPLAMLVLIERIERRLLIHIGIGLFILGLLLLIVVPGNTTLTLIGAMVIVLGYDTIILPAYMYTSELFPTRARGTASAIGDGVGHLGGAVAPFVLLPVLTGYGGIAAVFVIVAANVLAGVIIAFGPRTKRRPLTEIAS